MSPGASSGKERTSTAFSTPITPDSSNRSSDASQPQAGHAPPASFSVYGERGSIDVLAFRPEGSLLVVEAKTWIPDVGGMLMRLERKARLAPAIARERGWPNRHVGKLLVVRESGTSRRRVALHAATFDAALPDRTQAVRRWLRAPAATLAGLLFLPDDTHPVSSRRGRVRMSAREREDAAIPRRSIA